MTDAHRWRTLRRTALAGAAVAAMTLTASCGDGSAGTKPAAGDTAITAPSSSASSSTGATSPTSGATLDAAAVKQLFTRAMAAATSVHLDLAATGSVAMTGSGDMDMKAKPIKADLTLRSPALGGKDARVLMVDDAMFLRLAQLGDKYVKVPLTGGASPLGQLGLDSLDPAKLFDKFGDAISSGEYVGKESVAGQPADHYRLQVDAKAIVSALPDLAPQASAIPGAETVDLWLDSDGRYRRMRMVAGGETVTETFSRWGEPVTVTAPPARQVQDMGSALSGMGASSAS